MKLKVMLMLALLSIPTATWAGTVRMRCQIAHFKRSQQTEMRSASIRFNNGDPVNAATIERLTIYDFFGIVVHDSVAGDHPLNTDFTPFVDITTVPPNANYYIRTNHIWGNNSIPDLLDGIDGNQRGQFMSVVVKFSKRGNRRLFVLSTRARSRQLDNSSERAERSSNSGACFRVRRRDNGDEGEDD